MENSQCGLCRFLTALYIFLRYKVYVAWETGKTQMKARWSFVEAVVNENTEWVIF